MEIPFYVVSTLWVLTIVAWSFRERLHEASAHQERMEMLKLIKAESLNEFKAADQPIPPSKNFMKKFIDEAYQRKKDGDSDV